MFSVGVSDHCMVAHSLPDPTFGPAQRLHGATYTVEVDVFAPALGEHHVVMDLGALKDLVRGVLAPLDYRNLDDLPAFKGRLSTTERLAEYIADEIAVQVARLPEDAKPIQPASLSVRLRESPNAWADYDRPIP